MRCRWILSLAAPLLALSLLGCGSGGEAQAGPSTFDQASEIIRQQLIEPADFQGGVIVFGLQEALKPGDVVHAYQKEGFEPFPEPVTIEEETWFFWIDEAPGGMFAHPTRFVYLTLANGKLSVTEEQWWPVLNGRGLWLEDEEYWDEANWIYSNREEGAPGESRLPAGATGKMSLASRRLQGARPGSAIVINGWSPGERLKDKMEKSSDQMHDILTDAGFDTTYLGPKEDTNPDRNGEASTEERVRWFFNKAREMKPSQTLFVYITGHGGISESGTAALGSVFENLLKDALDDFDPGVHIIVLLDGCHSGAFNDSMVQVADITIASTDATSSAYADLDRYFLKTDVNPEDEGLEYTSGFVEDWKQIMADPAAKQRVQDRSSREGVNFWEALAPESHLTAVEKDFAHKLGWTAPLLVRGQPQTRPSPTPTPAATSTPPATPTPSVAALPPSGEIPVTAAVGEDRANHGPFIEMPTNFSLNYIIAADTITFSGPNPWVVVSGEAPDSDGSFFTTGKGIVAGFADITTEFSGSFEEKLLTGDYVMGADGGLPTGLAITYTITGTLPLSLVPPVSSAPTTTPIATPPDLDLTGAYTTTIAAQTFFSEQNRLFQTQDVDSLYARLHPAVIDLYGGEVCAAYLTSVIETPVQIDVRSASEIGTWIWVIDDRNIPIPQALDVEVDFTARGETVARTVHLALVGEELRWFTDCGDPLP